MSLRRAATAAATMFVAIACALAVPVSQLRTIAVVTKCCCPDPANCHCPDHKADHSTNSSIRACHRSTHVLAAPSAPSFAPAEIALAIAAPRPDVAIVAAPPGPKDAPAADEPYGPS